MARVGVLSKRISKLPEIKIKIAQITPSVGFNLFIIQDLAHIEITEVARHVIPLFFLLLVALVILTA